MTKYRIGRIGPDRRIGHDSDHIDPQKGAGVYETTVSLYEYWADDIWHCFINVSPAVTG